MLDIQENIPLRPKTTLKIGGNARWYAELKTKEDCEEATIFAKEKNCPLIVLGGGSNTIFADGTIEALVVRIKSDGVHVCHAGNVDSNASSSPVPSGAKRSRGAQHDTAAPCYSARYVALSCQKVLVTTSFLVNRPRIPSMGKMR